MSLLTAILVAQIFNLTFSPDSSRVAFTRDNDLWVRTVADSVETRLTFDGDELVLNGYASWLYYEEILGRSSKYKAFWWSPDSKKIAYYRFDNTNVSEFPIFSPFGQNGSLLKTRYPKAGQENPGVRIGFVDLENSGVNTVWADFDYSQDQYFGIPFWDSDSRYLYVQRMPRRQNDLALYAVEASSGKLKEVYHETYPTWIRWISGMLFGKNGLYMARDFESGWQQIYYLSYDGREMKRLTDGENWNVDLLKLDEKSRKLWFTAKRDSRLRPSLYRLDFGRKKNAVTALTDSSMYVSDVSISEDGRNFRARLSNARTPWYWYDTSKSRKETESAHECGTCGHKCQGYEALLKSHPRPEVVKITNDGYDLYGLMSLPENFDPAKKYPVVMQLYGGPGTPYVRDRWLDRDASDRWCWENGIIYIVVDPRSSGENGRRGMDEAFRRMTVIELQDYIAWAKWLGALPYVDASRIGVEGFSFGGTTTAMLVLRYPEFFCCGVAGGGVYDWALYDSFYTEIFMDTPQANPEGYKEASVLTFIDSLDAGAVSGRLKLTHGTGDDNVHFQNTLLLVDALQKAGIQFELMIYPDGMHGYRGKQKAHDQASDHGFWTRHLL